jgi:hypothetical protein
MWFSTLPRRVSPAPQAPPAPDSPRCAILPDINAEHPASVEKKVPYQVPDLPHTPDVPRYMAGPTHQDPPAHRQARATRTINDPRETYAVLTQP